MKKIFCLIVWGVFFCLCGCSFQERLVICPTEEYVVSCLNKVPYVEEIQVATENNDPNGNFNKAGGYIAHVFFSYVFVDQSSLVGVTVIDKGTSAGGSIEVYPTKKDAEKRNQYLTSFDGGILASGSHIVIGTVVVRTSNELSATQQKVLENNIVAVLTGNEDDIIDPFVSIIKSTKNAAENELLSYQGTISYLLSYDYSEREAEYIASICGANWKDIAVEKAENISQFYFETYNEFFCPNGMKKELTLEYLFGEDDANWAVSECSIDWRKNAIVFADNFCKEHIDSIFSPDNIIEYLWLDCGFATADVEFVVDNCGIVWRDVAIHFAESLYPEDCYSKKDIVNCLLDLGFSENDSLWAIENGKIEWDLRIWYYTMNVINKPEDEFKYTWCYDCNIKYEGVHEICPVCCFKCGLWNVEGVYPYTREETVQKLLKAEFKLEDINSSLGKYLEEDFFFDSSLYKKIEG